MLRFIPQQQWASTDDWEPHREIISSLYWDQDRPLKEVAEIMRRKHSFIATERMYKSRLKNWGLTKYLKAKEVEEVRREVANGKIGLPLIRGRIAGPKRLKQQVNRILPRELATATETAGHAGAISTAGSRSGGRNPSPLTGRMNAPNQFRYIEVCLKAVSDYSHSRIQANTWDPLGDYLSQESSDDWPNKVLLARATIQKGKMKDGFRLLDICLKNYRPLLCLEHPLLLIETYNAMLSLSEARYDLAESVIGYIVGLCRVVLGPSHPFTRLWTCLGASGMGMARQAAVVIVKSQLALLTTYFSPNAEFILIQQVDSARQLHEFGNLSMSDAERSIMDAIEKKQWKSDPDENDFVCWAKEMLASMYKKNKMFEEASAILDDITPYVNDPSAGLSQFTIYEYYSIRCQILKQIGCYEEVKRFFRERVDLTLRAAGPDHHYTLIAITDLDWQYGLKNDVEASKKLHEEFDFESTWETYCKKEDEREATLCVETGSGPANNRLEVL